ASPMKFRLSLSNPRLNNNHQHQDRPFGRSFFLFYLCTDHSRKILLINQKKDEQKSLTFFQHGYKIKLCKLKPISYCKVPTETAGKVQPNAFPDDPLPAGFLCALTPTK